VHSIVNGNPPWAGFCIFKPLRIVSPIAWNPDFLPTVGTPPLLPVARNPNSIRRIIIGRIIVGGRIIPPMDDHRRTYADCGWTNEDPKMAMTASPGGSTWQKDSH
jgi:hypothetical protein